MIRILECDNSYRTLIEIYNIIIIRLVDHGLHMIWLRDLSTTFNYLTYLNFLYYSYELFFYQSYYNNIILYQLHHHHTYVTLPPNCFKTRVAMNLVHQTNKAYKLNIGCTVHIYSHHLTQINSKKVVECQKIRESIWPIWYFV